MPPYLCRNPNPCILRAWNNYYGYSKYVTEPPEYAPTLDYFYSLVPDETATLSLPVAYFHVTLLENWIRRIQCSHLFVIRDTHIYVIGEQETKEWISFDWPRRITYPSLFDVNRAIQGAQTVIALYPASQHSVLQDLLLQYKPSSPFYMELKNLIVAAFRPVG